MDVSVIVVSYNTRELTCACLRSIQRWSEGFSSEIVVVDNQSNDGSADAVEQAFPETKVLRNADNLGFAAAVNQGAAASRGDYLILINSDAYLESNAFQKMWRFACASPEVGAVGCRVVYPDGTHQPTAGRFPALRLEIGDHLLRPLRFLPSVLRQNCIESRDFDTPREVDWLSGSCLLIRRKAFEDAGRFDTAFFLGEEDVDLGFQLKRKGWKVFYLPGAQAVHLGGKSKSVNPEWLRHFLLGRYRFYKKNYSAAHAALFRILALFSVRLRVAAGRMSGQTFRDLKTNLRAC